MSSEESAAHERVRAPRVVLIVDDDDGIRATLADVLREEGIAVACAANGIEALGYLQVNPAPRVILLDLMMPFMDGREFRAEQRRHPEYADIPVIVITAGRVEGQPIDADLVLRKPLDFDRLLAAIERFA